jgi:hypothetical protein
LRLVSGSTHGLPWLLRVDAVSAAEVNANVTDSAVFDRFLAAVARIEQLCRRGASPEELDQAVVRELIALLDALDDSHDMSGKPR